MTTLRISGDLQLPVDVITQTIGIFARKGAGKTYTAKRIVEEVVKARLPVVVLDPLGAWWGLRSSADGEHEGLAVYVLGGEHGHVPLEPSAGALIADLVIDHPGAYVLDLSDFVSDAEQDRFATAFMQRLYRGKARKRDPLLLVVDEADAFAPQQGQPGQGAMIGAAKTIARRARLRGIGSMWITQRPAILHADIRAMVELLIILQVTGSLDRIAIQKWLEGKADAETVATVIGSLGSLSVGEMWASSPAWLGLLVRTKASPAETFDSSKTPEVGEQRVEPTAFAAMDLTTLGAQIRETVEHAKENDPTALRARIRELEAAGGRPVVETIEKIVEVEVPVLNGEVDQLAAVAITLQHVGQEIAATGLAIVTAIERVHATPRSAHLSSPVEASGRASGGRSGAPRGEAIHRTRGIEPATSDDPAQQAVAGAPQSNDPPKIKDGARKMLEALAWFHPRGLTRAQLAMLADVSLVSGTVSSYLSALRQNGLIAEDGKTVGLSEAGLAATAELAAGKPPTTAELVEMWSRKLKAGAGTMLTALVDQHPRAFSRAELAEVAGVSIISGTVSSYLSAMRRAGLLDESDDGIRASGNLFLGGRS